jgi:hypothetical protein
VFCGGVLTTQTQRLSFHVSSVLQFTIRKTSVNKPQNDPRFTIIKRLRWSRGGVLAFGTKVRGFKPGRSRQIFQGEKILSTPSFGGEVKAVLSYVADLRHVKEH